MILGPYSMVWDGILTILDGLEKMKRMFFIISFVRARPRPKKNDKERKGKEENHMYLNMNTGKNKLCSRARL